MISIILLSGCVNNKEKSNVLSIPNVDDYSILYVQGVDTNGVNEETSTLINDNKKIKQFINKVNQMEVNKPPRKEQTKKIKELNQQGNYIFVLSDKETLDNKVYYMNFYKDGSIQFQHPNKKEVVYTAKEKHPELLKELKTLLQITY